MRKAIIVPDVGPAAAVLSLWFVRPGESLYAGDRVAELLLGGATFDVAAPCTGRLAEKLTWPGEPAAPGQVLGYVEEEE